MTTSRSTPRLRLTTLLLAGLLLLVATTERTAATGLAGLLLQPGGRACMAAAALGRIWSSVFIAGCDTQVVRGGPYAVVCHPLYASLLG
jgi:protein-S-isoprenylcysteine O-methyltransferase Ste14